MSEPRFRAVIRFDPEMPVGEVRADDFKRELWANPATLVGDVKVAMLAMQARLCN